MVSQTQVNVPRVVLDTNVVLSALLFKSGRLRWLAPLWTCGCFVPLVSKGTACELIRVLAYPKFKLSAEEQHTVLSAFLPYAEAFKTRSAPSLAKCRDPHDQMFLVLAEQGRADYLVTGDDDLLAVAGFSACPIVTPDGFRQKMAF